MNDGEMTTLELIHSAAKAEFLSKGFKSASLRNIVKTAGVTTGAFYGYYSSKAELFEALVSEAYNFVIDSYKAALREFADLPMEKQPEVMGMMNAYFEMAIHEMPLEKSKRYLKELHNFYTAGWRELMGT